MNEEFSSKKVINVISFVLAMIVNGLAGANKLGGKSNN
jgi:hypothetical protein